MCEQLQVTETQLKQNERKKALKDSNNKSLGFY